MHDKIAGCLLGMALGDALGAPTEFLSVDAILRQYPPNGPQELVGDPARVTDDTQMAIAVGRALLQTPQPYSPQTLDAALITAFSEWHDDPENNRAPGMTCMTSIARLMTGQRWQTATNIGSKGCGANMRVQPVALLPVDSAARAKLSQFQAALTHGHPTALAAADLTAWVIADLLHDGDIATLPARVRGYAESQQRVYHADWLGDLYSTAVTYPSGEDFIEQGWSECLHVLDRLDRALAVMDRQTDPCLLTGAGWIAEEALATALYCFLLYPDDPVAVMRRATVTSGDSDSIACIAGAFAGANKGLSALPDEWVRRIEYRDTLDEIASSFLDFWRYHGSSLK